MSPTISIITVTYNAAQWLERTILSVLSQSYPYIEYLIIDGGSTDGTVDMIRQYESGITYWVSESDDGLYDAMNKGLRKVSGEYVWFLNAGDTLNNSDTIQQMIASIRKKTLPDILYGETRIVNSEGEDKGMRRLKAPKKLTWKSFRMGMLVCHQSFIAKRTVAPEYDLTYRFSADYDWCIQCMKKAKHIHNTKLTLSRYLEEGMTTANMKASLKERYQIMCKYYGRFSTMLLHGWFAIRFYFAKLTTGKV